MKDYYYILGIAYGSSDDDLKKAYRKLSLKFHPDKNNGDKFFEERFKEINEAYETLINPVSKKKYLKEYLKKIEEPDAEIITFRCNKERIYSGDKISIEWETKYSTTVEIKPFGKQSLKGRKTFIINNINSTNFKIKIIAENATSTTSRTILVENQLFEDFKTHTETYQQNKKHASGVNSKKSNRSTEKVYTEIGIVLFGLALVLYYLGTISENPLTFTFLGFCLRIITYVELTKTAQRLNRDKTFWGIFSFLMPIIAMIVIGQLKPKVKH